MADASIPCWKDWTVKHEPQNLFHFIILFLRSVERRPFYISLHLLYVTNKNTWTWKHDSADSCCAVINQLCLSVPLLLTRSTLPVATTSASPGDSRTWSRRAGFGRYGEGTASTSSRSVLKLQLSLWPTSRYNIMHTVYNFMFLIRWVILHVHTFLLSIKIK